MNRRDEREMRAKFVSDALFWRQQLRGTKEVDFASNAMRSFYRGKVQSMMYAIKVVKGID